MELVAERSFTGQFFFLLVPTKELCHWERVECKCAGGSRAFSNTRIAGRSSRDFERQTVATRGFREAFEGAQPTCFSHKLYRMPLEPENMARHVGRVVGPAVGDQRQDCTKKDLHHAGQSGILDQMWSKSRAR